MHTMTDDRYAKILEMVYYENCYIPISTTANDIMLQIPEKHALHLHGVLVPNNKTANKFIQELTAGEITKFEEVITRDLKFHKCYFLLLGEIWGYLPIKFKLAIPKESFYKWLKHLKGQYDIKYTFNDGSAMIEYDSISFGRMSEKRFREYVREQLPFIYTEVIEKFFQGEEYNTIIENIEKDFERFMEKLNG